MLFAGCGKSDLVFQYIIPFSQIRESRDTKIYGGIWLYAQFEIKTIWRYENAVVGILVFNVFHEHFR